MGDSLLQACRSGNVREAARSIHHGADVHVVDSFGRTALVYAAINCHEIVPLLLNSSIDINAGNSAGWAPIFYVSGAGKSEDAQARTECLRNLLRARANPNSATTYGVTALMLACGSGNMPAVQLLLDYRGDAHAASAVGMTPLIFGADKGYVHIVLERGAHSRLDGVSSTEMRKLLKRFGSLEHSVNRHLRGATDSLDLAKCWPGLRSVLLGFTSICELRPKVVSRNLTVPRCDAPPS